MTSYLPKMRGLGQLELLGERWRRAAFWRGRHISVFSVIATLLGALLAALVVYPLVVMCVRVFAPDGELSLSAFRQVANDPAMPTILRDTTIVLGTSTLLALAIGLLFAWCNERSDARMGWASRVLPLTPLLLPPIALSVGWLFLADERAGYLNVVLRRLMKMVGIERETGPINITSWWGMIFVYTLWLVPFAYLILSAALRNIDPALEEASRINGAGPIQTALKVSLPAIRPAIVSATLSMLVSGIAVFSIGRTIGVNARVRVLSVHIVSLVQSYPSQLDEAVVLGLLVLVVVGTLWLAQRRVSTRARHATIGGKASSHSIVALGPWRWVARSAMIVYLAATSVLPILGLVLVALQPFWTPRVDWRGLSFENFGRLLGSGSFARSALKTSLTLGVTGATAGMIVAAIIAVYARQGGARRAVVVDAITKAPGAISHVVVGVAFIVALAGAPFNLHGTVLILFLAYLVIYMPQAAIAAGSASDQVGRDLYEASVICGAKMGRTFGRIALPLMLPGLAAGWALLFVVMAGDLTASALLAGTKNPVVGFVFLDIYENGTYSMVAAMGTIMGLISTLVVAIVMAVARPRFGVGGVLG